MTQAEILMLMGTPLIFLSLALFVGVKDAPISDTASVERANTPAQATVRRSGAGSHAAAAGS